MLFNTYDPFRTPFPAPAARSFDYDIVKSESGVTLRIDIPGVDPDTIDLTVEGRSLRVDTNRQSAIPEGAQVTNYRRKGGAISQTFEIGERLDAENLTADYEFGVLVVNIPVAESAKLRKVAVGAGAPVPEAIDVASDTDATVDES